MRPSTSTSPLVRRLPSRTKSLDKTVRGLLNRSLSFSNRSTKRISVQSEDEFNIFCDDMVSRSFCLEKITEVKKNTQITKLEIEDLLISSHLSLLPVIKSLVLSGNRREWQWVHFLDTIPTEELVSWVEQRDTIRKDYEESVDDASLYETILSFHARVRIARGSCFRDVAKTLKALHRDTTVSELRFEGDLCNFDAEIVPAMIKELINRETGELLKDVQIYVVSDWNASASSEWKTMVESCIRELSGMKNCKNKTRSSSKDRTPVRRCRSNEDGAASNASRRQRFSELRRQHSARRDAIVSGLSDIAASVDRMQDPNTKQTNKRRGGVGRSASFNIKRDSADTCDDSASSESKRDTVNGDVSSLQRSKSFSHRRPKRTVVPDYDWESGTASRTLPVAVSRAA